MTTTEILNEIVKEGKTDEICRILLNMVLADKESIKNECMEYKACLSAIHKINRGKDDAIDALSEV